MIFLVSNIFNVLYVKHICRLEKNKKNTHKNNNSFLFFFSFWFIPSNLSRTHIFNELILWFGFV